MNPPRVAVVGAGPSGLYTAASLVAADRGVAVDVLDRLPTPYGLVRYGVAPDHARMKGVTRVLAKPFLREDVRYLGNVEVGRDVTHEELSAHYDAVVYACGTEHDRRLGIPGEGLRGAVGAADFVRWYNGHPDAASGELALDAEHVAVVGAGNVALDVARVLGRTAAELRGTDVPARVLATMERSAVRDVHILVRRGPADVQFTPSELLQLSELDDADVLLHPEDVGVGDPQPASDRRVRLNLEILRNIVVAPARSRGRHLHLWFHSAPVEIVGTGSVEGVVVERTALQEGRLVGTGECSTLPVGMVITAIGFRGSPVPGLPFDEEAGTVPHDRGRVVAAGRPVPGVYVAGWLKRGPSGVIGTNKPDGSETAAAVLADLPTASGGRPDLLDLLSARAVVATNWQGWLKLEAYEAALGRPDGRERVKVPDLATMLQICTRP